MRRVGTAAAVVLLVWLCPVASAAAAPHERLAGPDDGFVSGPAVDDGHVVWATSRDATVRAAAPGGRPRVLGLL